jgi:hypothetical protein
MPAKAGIAFHLVLANNGIPAFAGMTIPLATRDHKIPALTLAGFAAILCTNQFVHSGPEP